MELFVKTAGGVLISLILILMLGSRSKEMALVLTVLACCMCAAAVVGYLEPLIRFVSSLEEIAGLDTELVRILLKATGIGLLSEFAALVCADSGAASLGKMVRLLGNAVILWLSLPLFTILLEQLQKISGGL